MPWEIVGTCVHKKGSSSPIPGGCHDTVEEAQRHMAALYANEPSARTSAVERIRQRHEAFYGDPPDVIGQVLVDVDEDPGVVAAVCDPLDILPPMTALALRELDEWEPPTITAAPTNESWWEGEFDWGSPGAFTACVEVASGKVDDPEAFCAQRHFDATGEWPGHKAAVTPGRKLDEEQRAKLAEQGKAMKGEHEGSFPIRNTTDLKHAIESIGRAKDYDAAKRWIIKRARELNATGMLPEDWTKKAKTAGAVVVMAGNAQKRYKYDEEESGRRKYAIEHARGAAEKALQAWREREGALGRGGERAFKKADKELASVRERYGEGAVKEATAGTGWDESDHPRDEQGKFTNK